MNYADWITANVTGDGYGQCAEVTLAMAAAFPELKRVRGHYYCRVWGERTHWWLVAPDGAIVDPTAAQFPTKGRDEYVEWHEGDEEPSGKCPNCDGYVYGGGVLPQRVMGVMTRLAAIQARAEKATEAPWCWESVAEKSNEFVVGTGWRADGARILGRIVEGDDYVEDAVIRGKEIGANESGHARFADAAFISHSRSDVPWLLARIEQVRAYLVLLRDACWCEGTGKMPKSPAGEGEPVEYECIGCKQARQLLATLEEEEPQP